MVVSGFEPAEVDLLLLGEDDGDVIAEGGEEGDGVPEPPAVSVSQPGDAGCWDATGSPGRRSRSRRLSAAHA